jgi:hypothetical protein
MKTQSKSILKRHHHAPLKLTLMRLFEGLVLLFLFLFYGFMLIMQLRNRSYDP